MIDVEGYGAHRRTNRHRIAIRQGVHELTEAAFAAAGIPWERCDCRDLGDGLLILAPPEIPKSDIVDAMPDQLAAAVSAHNASAAPEEQVRLRAAIHAGEVTYDDHGVVGAAVNFTFRLCDSPALKSELATAPGVLAVIVSSWIYDEVVRHGPPERVTRYRERAVAVKETNTVGWIQLPGQGGSSPASPPTRVDQFESWQYKAYVNHDQLFGTDKLIDIIVRSTGNVLADQVTSIVGAGGIGKTAIAYEAVRELRRRGHFTKVAWTSAANPQATGCSVTTEGFTTVYWLELLRDLAAQLDFDLGPSRTLWESEFARQVAGLPSGDQLLVVVDNLETLPDATDAVGRLRRMGVFKPHALLVTTRWELQSHLPDIAEFRVRPLSPEDSVLFIKHLSMADPDLQEAGDRALAPILDATEGNPFLIKLAVQQYLSSHRPLDHVLRDLRDLRAASGGGEGLAETARSYLYTASLQELERRRGTADADALLASFCVKGRGDSFHYDELEQISGIQPAAGFLATLSTACQLSIVTSFGDGSIDQLRRRYTIHSLLYDFTCGMS
ncbi:hypothetical protein AMES_2369 [Amycolatopsis mediterranei S699]|uniref:Uncharacterized protein n=2 Tax=Amycolatopsis mediterranei TaxID=33910 RepID=A0A0H3D1N8_AMYMU|nr:NB-ARC domain-containing protein [Amycolatopsis mediterranei]ADJ44192.1 conserved hypothetical protein [Amycolatopsis mediterranei U32]AEK40928.1 hypothetical protein RAM_12190 [Amycolatopsis mediterranei S699]AFO75905.1 hypothetical protein AMES_2369 [Amycolatopsis mediterranei S699]AGT83034.1 hypothetical protein B737_2370 [Amycolatopsis mediterranei RB]KDO06891.1 hypothetical protein DV26_32340 [Amycolatopsis mediterranei]